MEGQNPGINPAEQAAQAPVVQDKAEIAAQEQDQIVVKIPKRTYSQLLVTQMQQIFSESDGDLDLGFVRLGEWISINSVGEFIVLSTKNDKEPIVLGRVIDVVIAGGEGRWSMWGAEDTQCWGQQIINVPFVLTNGKDNKDEAIATYSAWAERNPELAAEQEKEGNYIAIRFQGVLLPVRINVEKNGGEAVLGNGQLPRIYLSSFSPDTTSKEYTPWLRRMKLQGDMSKGIKPMGQISDIIVRLSTKPKTKNGKNFNSIAFDSVGLFNPAEFGLPSLEDLLASH